MKSSGMIGGIIFIIAWILFLRAGLKVARNAPDRQGKLIAVGITIWLTYKHSFHMAANLGVIPLTGMPLPFVTYGGSGTIVAMIGVAILLNISKFQVVEKKHS
ncbi:FtsW/RodA/SpoVE family cell cycle protein [Candidatus Nomurabacteria bacterium]|nr:FtsW/RodA/SpoVE family cell cycle protein [Candidatus Nomurabacteria bacterium]